VNEMEALEESLEAFDYKDIYELMELVDALEKHLFCKSGVLDAIMLGMQKTTLQKVKEHYSRPIDGNSYFFASIGEKGIKTLQGKVERGIRSHLMDCRSRLPLPRFTGVLPYRWPVDMMELDGQKVTIYDAMRRYDQALAKVIETYGLGYNRRLWSWCSADETIKFPGCGAEVFTKYGRAQGKKVIEAELTQLQALLWTQAEVFSNVVDLSKYRH